MKKRFWGVLSVVVVLVLVAIWLDPTRVGWGLLTGQNFFDGRPTDYWRQAIVADPARQADALDRLEQGGADAVEVLADLLDSGHIPAEVQCTALEILGGMGTDARAAGDAVLAALNDPDPHVRAVAAAELAKVGVAAESAVPPLVKMLEGEQKRAAARALSEYRTAAESALPLLVETLQDKSLDTETRWNAARTIGKVGPPAASVADVLVACLEDEADTVREHSAEALGDIGPNVVEHAPALAAVLDDPATRVRRDAVRSLGQLGPVPSDVINQMKKRLEDPEEIVREAARNALQAVAPEELPQVEKKGVPSQE